MLVNILCFAVSFTYFGKKNTKFWLKILLAFFMSTSYNEFCGGDKWGKMCKIPTKADKNPLLMT